MRVLIYTSHMEKLPIVHEDTGSLLGYSLPRAEAIATQAWCRSTNVFVLNHEGKVLCHQRSLVKERFPGVWCTHLGGHVGEDETFETNAHKELGEEAGIHVPASSILAWRTTKIPTQRLWVREFVTVVDEPVEKFVPQPGEVEQFAWKTIEEILDESEKNPAMWLDGTHDFRSEYMCLRAAILGAHAAGGMEVPEDLHIWHPLTGFRHR